MKICTKCKAEKPYSDFFVNKRTKDGFFTYCKPCNAENVKAWQKKNPDKKAARNKAYYEANKEKVYASNRAWAIANPEKVAEMSKAWATANPEKCAYFKSLRRARQVGASGTHTAKEIAAIFESQRGLCVNCHVKLSKSGGKKFHLDHIAPLARGGSNDKYNLQCLCPSCNLKKNVKDPIEWAQKNGRLL